MAQTMHFVDGRSDLKQQEDQLNFIETVAFCEVLTYTKIGIQEEPVNRAVFDDVAFDSMHRDLELISVGQGQNPGAVIAQRIAAGKNVVFHSKVFVDGNESVVVAFR